MAERIMFTSSSSSSLDESQSNAGSTGSNADSTKSKENSSKKETKKSKSIKKDRRDPRRFLGEGVNFKAKLIGVRDVPQPRGEKMAQETLQELKVIKKTSGNHKRKILINIYLEGLKIKDEKTKEVIYLHPVHKISFISQDASDNRAFGYIYGSPDNVHTFYAIKSEKAAHQIVMCMRDLFHIAFELKKKEIEQWRQQQSQLKMTNHSPSTSLGCESGTGSIISDNSSVPSPSSSNSSTSGFSNGSSQSDTYETFHDHRGNEPGSLLLDLTAEGPRINGELLSGDMLGPLEEQTGGGDAFFSDPWGYLRAMANDSSEQQDMVLNDPFIVGPTSQQQAHVPAIFLEAYAQSTVTCNLPPFLANDPFNTSFVDTPFNNFATTPVPIAATAASDVTSTDDKYAALADISGTDVTDVTPIVNQGSSPAIDVVPVNDGGTTTPSATFEISPLPPPIIQRQTSSPVSTAVFSDLDPLGKDRPYVDKKDFFYDVKNPPKKVLKDLIAENGFAAPDFDVQGDDSCPPPNAPPPLPPPFYRRSLTSPTSSLEDASMVGSSSSIGSANSSPVGEVLLPPPPPPPPRPHVSLNAFLPPPPPLPPKHGSQSSRSSDSGSPISEAPSPIATSNMLSSPPIPIPSRRGRTAYVSTSSASLSSSSMMSTSSISLSTSQNPNGYYNRSAPQNGSLGQDPNNNPVQNRHERTQQTTIVSWPVNGTSAPNDTWNFGPGDKGNNLENAQNDANAVLTNRMNQCNITNSFVLSPPPQFNGGRRQNGTPYARTKVNIFQKEEDPFADDDFFAAIKADGGTTGTPYNNGGVWSNPFSDSLAQNR